MLKNLIKKYRLFFLKYLLTISFFISPIAFAVETRFVSGLDADIGITCVAIVPIADNVEGIYSRPISPLLKEWFESDRRFEFKYLSDSKPITPESLETSAERVLALQKKSGCNSVLSGRLTRGPGGLELKMSLFAGGRGILLATRSENMASIFETSDVMKRVNSMTEELFNSLPYQGVILSRKGQLVTLNLGKRFGLSEGDNITVIKIVGEVRHPKHQFLISTQNEVIGRIVIEKVEDFLSFGSINLEREESKIVANDKVVRTSFKDLGVIPKTKDGTLIDKDLGSPLSFGARPREWTPERDAQYGQVALMGGFTQYSLNQNLATSGGVSGSNSLSPSLTINLQAWITKQWIFEFQLRQMIARVSNGLAGSSPSTLTATTQNQNISSRYNFLLEPDNFFGPQFYTGFGLLTSSSTIDDSTPTAFTSLNFGGLYLSLGGEFPIASDTQEYRLGAELNYFFGPMMSEGPVSSGSSQSAKISQFNIFGKWAQTKRWSWRSQLNYDVFSASFSGVGSRSEPATSASVSMVSIVAGIEYQF